MMELLKNNYTATFANNISYLKPRGEITVHQRVFFSLGISSLCYWVYLLWERFTQTSKTVIHTDSKEEGTSTTASLLNVENGKVSSDNRTKPLVKPRAYPPVTKADAFKHVIAVFLVLCYYFVCDYMHYFARGPRIYNRDLFIFLIALLFIVNIIYTSKVTSSETNGADKLLNRDQTEEWKGWMQVMFIWYHYYAAKETYNLIRIFIACYVWMTGFGNFSFYWIRKDYSIRRIFNSLFRLNFLVLLTCMVTNNSYMLYYICAMHTFWYFSVYAMMRPFYQYNENPKVITFKFLVYFLVVFIIFDIKGVSSAIFSPLGFILNYDNSIHEWVFRSTLDHYATLLGMLCAYFHPNTEALLKRINAHPKGNYIVTFIGLLLCGVNYLWYQHVYILDKYTYNRYHPYTFFIPLLSYIILRNCTSFLRRWHCALFGYLGKITLETYISQLHIYLIQDAKGILVFFPSYPLVNFLLNSVIYVVCSNTLFKATIALNAYIFPSDAKQMWKNIIYIVLGIIATYLLVYIVSFL